MKTLDAPALLLYFILSICLSAFLLPNKEFTAVRDTLQTAQIKSAFLLHPSVAANNIHVQTDNSRVYLRGVVHSQKEYQVAIFLSKTVPGITHVITSELAVKNA